MDLIWPFISVHGRLEVATGLSMQNLDTLKVMNSTELLSVRDMHMCQAI